MHPILVVSERWQTRALLAAQIGEMTDRDVVSAASVNEALGLVKLGGMDPALLVVDAFQQIDRGGVERLMAATRGVPLVVVVSRLRRDSFDSLRGGFSTTLLRPVSIGEVARVAVQILEGRP